MTKPFHRLAMLRGFTLVEAVVVIVVTGILAAVVAVFISGPVGGYVDATRRAILSDMADLALRRMGRDIRSAVPNSVRVNAIGLALEFIPTVDGARYRGERTDVSGVATGSPLGLSGSSAADIGTTGATVGFDTYGVNNVLAGAGDYLVIFNTGQSGTAGCASGGADAYQGCNRRTVVAAAVNSISYTSTGLGLPFDSPGRRVDFVPAAGPVSYVCINPGVASNNGTGRIMRYTGYGWNVAQAVPAAGGTLLAENISACRFSYSPGVTQTNGLVTLLMTITRSGEAVTLYHEVHVDNQP